MPPPSQAGGKDLLLILTEHYKFAVLEYTTTGRQEGEGNKAQGDGVTFTMLRWLFLSPLHQSLAVSFIP